MGFIFIDTCTKLLIFIHSYLDITCSETVIKLIVQKKLVQQIIQVIPAKALAILVQVTRYYRRHEIVDRLNQRRSNV